MEWSYVGKLSVAADMKSLSLKKHVISQRREDAKKVKKTFGLNLKKAADHATAQT